MSKPISSLLIKALELPVLLGATPEERQSEQTVFLDMELRFKDAPSACQSDQLQETICYDSLIQTLRLHLKNREFQLIEHLAADIYHHIQKQLALPALLKVTVLKYPTIKGLSGGATFCYGDF